MHRTAANLIGWWTCCLLASGPASDLAGAAPPVVTPPPQLAARWAAPAGWTWRDAPLRSSLQELAAAAGVCLFLDRRVDPDQLVDFAVQDRPFGEALAQLADHLGVGIGFVGPVTYLGPRWTAERVATVAAMKTKEAVAAARLGGAKTLGVLAWGWPILAEPRRLCRELAQEAGVELEGLDQIPHDLWPAVQLPPMSWAHRMTLVLAGFDLSFTLSAPTRTAFITPMPADPHVDWRTPAPPGTEERLAAIPGLRIRRQGRFLLLEGRAELLWEAAALVGSGGPPRPRSQPARKVYTLQVRAPVGAILKTVARQAELEVRVDPAATARLDKRVAVSVRDATLDELLRAALEPAGLTFQRDGRRLVVRPAP